MYKEEEVVLPIQEFKLKGAAGSQLGSLLVVCLFLCVSSRFFLTLKDEITASGCQEFRFSGHGARLLFVL